MKYVVVSAVKHEGVRSTVCVLNLTLNLEAISSTVHVAPGRKSFLDLYELDFLVPFVPFWVLLLPRGKVR